MNKYEKYKKVDLPWLEEVPEHWEVKKVKRYSVSKKELNKGNIEKNILSLTYKGVIKNNIDTPNGLVPKSYETYQRFFKNDLVFKLIDLENIKTSRVGLVAEDGAMSPAYIRLTLDDNFIPKYGFYYFYKLYIEQVYNNLGSGVRSTMSSSDLRDLELPIPPLAEQEQIAAYLDWKINEIDRLIAVEKEKINVLKEKELSETWNIIFNGLLTKKKYKKISGEYINQIPEEWKYTKLKNLFEIKKRIAGKEGYSVLSITQKGIKVKDISKNAGQMASDYSNYQIVEIGDFAMNHMDLLTGYIDISNFNGVTSPDYRVFTTKSGEVYDRYFLILFQLFYKFRIFYKFGKGASSTGRWRLPAEEFLNFYVPLPSKEEQQQIVEVVQKTKKANQHTIEMIENKVYNLESLKHSLISEVVTGKIDVRDVVIPKYEKIDTKIEEEDLEE